MTSAPECVRQRTRALAAVAALSSILAFGPGRAYAQTEPTYPGTDWPVSTPEAEGMDPVKFADAMANMPPIAIVIKNGKIIGTKGDITRPGPLYSGSKALLATLAGLLLQQGQISMETLVPGSDVPTAPLAAMKHFLTMTSDFNLDPHSPGDHYAYSNSGAIHYGEFLIYTFYPGVSEIQALRNAYLDKLGIQDPFSLVGAISGWGGGGFVVSTRDLARLGYLILRNGVWQGERLMPQWFIDGLYIAQIPAAATAGGTGSGEFDNQVNVTPRLPGTYSWGFWLPNGSAGYEGSRSNTVACTVTGSYGTSMHVIPKYDMILAGVNTVSTMTGGRISGALIDQFAAAVLPPAPTSDKMPPVVKMTGPANGATVSGWITISADASDNVAVKYVQFYLDGMPLGAPHTTAPYTVNWNSLTVPNGDHVIGANSSDYSGNIDSAIPFTVTVNNGAPPPPPPATSMTVTRLTLINADTDQPVTGYDPIPNGAVLDLSKLPTRNLNIEATTDPVSVGSVQFTLDGSVLRVDSAVPYAMAGDTAGNYAAWTPPAGAHTVTATPFSGSGASGSPGTPLTIAFSVLDPPAVDATPPTVSITSPTANSAVQQGTVTVSASASDNVGVVGVQFLLDGAPLGAEVKNSPYSVTWNTTGLAGAHTLAARARDAAGNATTSTTISVTVDPPPLPSYDVFVQTMYADLLDRQPDPGGFAYWVGELQSGHITRAQFAYLMFASPEFHDNGFFVVSLYEAVFRRDPDFGGWLYYLGNLQSGNMTPIQIADIFVQSPEFQSTYGTLSDSDFVHLVYVNVMQREPDPGGFAYWLGRLTAGTITRAGLMFNFTVSEEFQNRVRNRALATLLYLGFLRRSPDPSGADYWTGQLDAGMPPADVINGFITSPEYLARF